MLEIKQYSEIKKGIRYVPFDINTNSKLYLNGLELTKVPSETILLKGELEKTLNHVDEKKLDCCVKVNNLIYKDSRFIAYTMKFYKDYKSLTKLMSKDFSLKKQDCLNVEKVFNILTENGVQVVDHTLSNVLLNKNGDVLVCDLDGLKVNNSEQLVHLNRRALFVITLAYLYRIPSNEIFVLLRNNDNFLIDNNKELFKIFTKVNLGEKANIKELLDLIDEKDVKVKRRELKRSVEYLKESGYFRQYF